MKRILIAIFLVSLIPVPAASQIPSPEIQWTADWQIDRNVAIMELDPDTYQFELILEFWINNNRLTPIEVGFDTEFEEVELEFKDEAITEIAKKAISKKTGARGLRSILENILLKTMFELPDMENVIKITVDAAAVKGASEPIITYGKKPSTSVA